MPAPPGLTAAVMSQIRVLVRDVWYTLQITELGAIRIAARIVAALARDSARMVPGVRVAFGRSTQGKLAALAERATLRHRHPHAAVGVLGRTAVVDLAVAVTYEDPVHQVARDIQQHVIATLRDQVGLQNVTVNVTVDDILTDEDRGADAIRGTKSFVSAHPRCSLAMAKSLGHRDRQPGQPDGRLTTTTQAAAREGPPQRRRAHARDEGIRITAPVRMIRPDELPAAPLGFRHPALTRATATTSSHSPPAEDGDRRAVSFLPCTLRYLGRPGFPDGDTTDLPSGRPKQQASLGGRLSLISILLAMRAGSCAGVWRPGGAVRRPSRLLVSVPGGRG